MRVRKLSKLRNPRALAVSVWITELRHSAAALVMLQTAVLFVRDGGSLHKGTLRR